MSQRSVIYSYRTDTDSSGFEGKSTAATIAVGNQWESSRDVVLAIDWIGYAMPMSTSITNESLSGSNQLVEKAEFDKTKTTLKNEALIACVLDNLKTWTFPRPEE